MKEIIDGFYYPPIGKRSLGSANYWRVDKAKPAGIPCYKWRNENAILGMKLETVKGVSNPRYLAKLGVDFSDFGGRNKCNLSTA